MADSVALKAIKDTFATEKDPTNRIGSIPGAIVAAYKKANRDANLVLITPESAAVFKYTFDGFKFECIHYKPYNIYVVSHPTYKHTGSQRMPVLPSYSYQKMFGDR